MGANSSSENTDEAIRTRPGHSDTTRKDSVSRNEENSVHANRVATDTHEKAAPSHITCSAWVVTQCSDTWSSSNVVYTDQLTIPAPLPHQVCVKVHAAGVHRLDAQRTIGKPAYGLSNASHTRDDGHCAVNASSGNSVQSDDNNNNNNNNSSAANVDTSAHVDHTQSHRGTQEPLSSLHACTASHLPLVLGMQGAGVIVAVGWADDAEDATFHAPAERLRVGDRVMFYADAAQQHGGSFAQYALMSADVVCKIPQLLPPMETQPSRPLSATSDDSANQLTSPTPVMDLSIASTLPIAAQGAYLALFDKLRIEREHSIFVCDASHDVGSVAVQMAHYYGLYVLASCPEAHMSYVRGLGADVVISSASEEVDVVAEVMRRTHGYGVDYVLDASPEARRADRHAGMLRFGGAMCVFAGVLEPRSDALFQRQISVHYIAMGMMHRYPYARQQLRHMGEWVLRLYLDGAFRVKVTEVPFRRAPEALASVMRGDVLGEVVLTDFHANENDHAKECVVDRDRIR